MTTRASQYESAITAEEYRALVDCKYRANVTGWALVDEHGGVRGWHQQIPGDPRWSDRHSAMRGFRSPTAAAECGRPAGAGSSSPTLTAICSAST